MNKVVVLGRVGSIAFTGLAHLDGRRPNDELIMDAMASAFKNDDGVHRLAHQATRRFRANRGIPDPAKLVVGRTSFVAVGFSRQPARIDISGEHVEPVFPFLAVVSNAQRDLTDAWEPRARKKFDVSTSFLDDRTSFYLHVAGQPLLGHESSDLHRQLRQVLQRTRNPEPALRLMARMIRRVSQRREEVGNNVMCVASRRDFLRPIEADAEGNFAYYPITVPIKEHALEEINYFKHFRGRPEERPLGIYIPGELRVDAPHYGPSYVDDQASLHSVVLSPSHMFDAVTTELESVRAGRSRP